jgi:hypothetical protein
MYDFHDGRAELRRRKAGRFGCLCSGEWSTLMRCITEPTRGGRERVILVTSPAEKCFSRVVLLSGFVIPFIPLVVLICLGLYGHPKEVRAFSPMAACITGFLVFSSVFDWLNGFESIAIDDNSLETVHLVTKEQKSRPLEDIEYIHRKEIVYTCSFGIKFSNYRKITIVCNTLFRRDTAAVDKFTQCLSDRTGCPIKHVMGQPQAD